jgi:hypothetical protein
MISIRFEKGVNQELGRRIKEAVLRGGCPICGEKYDIHILVENAKRPAAIVEKICHTEFITTLNQKLPNNLQVVQKLRFGDLPPEQ